MSQPLRAVNTDGKWRVIVNGVKYHYETLTQTARIEECTTAGSACPLVPPCYETKCLQKNIYHRYTGGGGGSLIFFSLYLIVIRVSLG